MYTIKEGDTNVKQITKFMEWGSPLNQGFVMQAMDEMAKAVVDQKEELLKQENSFISMKAWVKCATDWQECRKKAKGE